MKRVEELEEFITHGSFSLRRWQLVEEDYMPSASSSDRIFVLLSGKGRFIKGHSFGEIEAPAIAYVKKGELFGFSRNGEVLLLEISEGAQEERDTEEVYDLRTMEKSKRHRFVMEKFKDLGVGEGFYIVNDHDPLPLYFQLNMFFMGKVGWSYERFGGDYWKVLIRKLG